MGGLSSERSVSIATGEAVVAALGERRYDAVPVYVDRDLDLALRQAQIDVAFIALRGRYGEDGCVQGLLEIMGIPYTGSHVLASALAMHKVRAKELFQAHGLTTPRHVVVRGPAGLLGAIGALQLPVVVKPVSAGSSVGVTLVRDPDALASACEHALYFDEQALIEPYLSGQEITVAILGDHPLGAAEVVTGTGIHDLAAKRAAAAQSFLPPRLAPERYRRVLLRALAAHRALGCTGATCVDLISCEEDDYVLEVNTCPGLSPNCLLPRIAESAGLPYEDLIEAILSGASLATARPATQGAAERGLRSSTAGRGRRPVGLVEHH